MAARRFENVRSLYVLSSLGIMFALSIFIGLVVGIYLDKWLGTKPLMTLLFLVFGIISAFLSLYREIRKLADQEDNGRIEDDISES